MKRFEQPTPINVAWDGRQVLGFEWRGRKRLVSRTLEVWLYRSTWWRSADLHGEQREYHKVQLELGEFELMCQINTSGARQWFVTAVWD
jgi:hypothetical protein